MASSAKLQAKDREFVQIVQHALEDATARSGEWLKCRPGCAQCCHGVFAINQLDAERLRLGLAELARSDPDRARRILSRAEDAVERLSAEFPGDVASGRLAEDDASVAAFEHFANHEPCPVLDPLHGTCDLYAWRPMTCRIFGPPVRSEDGLGVCELCFVGASVSTIEACELKLPPPEIEQQLNEAAERETGAQGSTIIAFALTRPSLGTLAHPTMSDGAAPFAAESSAASRISNPRSAKMSGKD
ncbi:MAG: YkgJ family cysteine cluster protein [Acidobacteriaceae bacterium]